MFIVSDSAALQAGRLEMKRRCIACAMANTPANVVQINIRKSLSGVAWHTAGIMAAPRPFTRKSLYIFLHECAHMTLHNRVNGIRYVEEMEAEKWAHARMREAGIAIPRSMTLRAKAYVHRKIRQARASGAKRIDPAAIRFVRVQRDGVTAAVF